MITKTDKWVKRWNVKGSKDNTWVVAIDKGGNYGCSCPIWKFKRQECKHIKHIKNGGGEINNLPEIRFGMVHRIKQVKGKTLIPLVPMNINSTHFSASNAYVLWRMGYPVSVIINYTDVLKNNSMKAVEEYILENGIMTWDEKTFYTDNRFDKRTKVVPVHQYYMNQNN